MISLYSYGYKNEINIFENTNEDHTDLYHYFKIITKALKIWNFNNFLKDEIISEELSDKWNFYIPKESKINLE